jgi:hypothetical protein
MGKKKQQLELERYNKREQSAAAISCKVFTLGHSAGGGGITAQYVRPLDFGFVPSLVEKMKPEPLQCENRPPPLFLISACSLCPGPKGRSFSKSRNGDRRGVSEESESSSSNGAFAAKAISESRISKNGRLSRNSSPAGLGGST